MIFKANDAHFCRRGVIATLRWGFCALWVALPAHAANTGIPHQSIQQIFPSSKVAKTSDAEPLDPNEPVVLEADAMGYDKDQQIVVAIGHVNVAQGAYVVNADKLTYFQQTDKVLAEGNVSVLQPSGDVFFSDRAELNSNLTKGIAQNFKARLSDDSVLAARNARRVNAAVTELHKTTYSPCHICEDIAPFWQLKSNRTKVDDKNEKITFYDTQMEIFGVPAFYSPYLSGPTPDADAKSGILSPTYSAGGSLGANIKIPYYWRIADDKEATITPWFFSNDNPLVNLNYRQLTDHGQYSLQTSGINGQKFDANGAKISGTEFRGNVAATGEEWLTDYSRVGFDINRVSDQTYLQRYRIGGGENGVLFSQLFAETAQQRNYASITGLSIQGLRTTDDSKTTPQIWPTLDGYYETVPLDNGLRFHVAGNAQSLTRDIGANQRRVSVTTGATYPYITDNGQLINASANFRQDMYDVDHVTLPDGSNFDGTKARSIPQGALQWRYPFVRPVGDGAVTIEPLVLGVVQPNGSNPSQIENEDSRLLELNDTNFFDIDRTPGYDVVDSGGRLAYGFRTEYMISGDEAIDGLIGQNYSFSSSTPFPNSTTPGERTSDIIGRIGFTVQPFSLAYRFALADNDGTLNRSSLTTMFNKPWLSLNVSYNSIKNNSYIPDSQEISSTITIPVAEEWKIYASGVRDLELDRMSTAGAGAIYHNECFDFMLDGLRNYTHDRDVPAGTSVTFRLGFKNLGVLGG